MTVRERVLLKALKKVVEASEPGTGYTTILKLLQIMTEKGLVKQLDSGRAHVYEAAITRDQTQRQTVRELVDRVFEGSANQLVQHALTERPASREEIVEIRRLLDSLEAQK